MENTKVLSTLKITFDSDAAREHFRIWLCGQGEQDYWMWMECREQEEEGNITATRFDYSLKDMISTECGRMNASST